MAGALLAAVAAGAGACGGDKATPTSPTAAANSTVAGGDGSTSGPSATNPDGSTLKVTAPTNLQPTGRARVDSRTPTLTWTNAQGKYQSMAFTYQLEFYKNNDLATTVEVPQGSGTTTSWAVPADLDYDTLYRWRARVKLGTDVGPWSVTSDFISPLPPAPIAPAPGGGGGGGVPYGPIRSISFNEAFQIIVAYHNASGVNLGRSSTREGRVAWLFAAAAIVHYGHPTFNPQGGDRNWCVKDAGGGRPPSDDVIVDCRSREAWDLISGAGADGYTFDWHSVGRLGSEQNVYPPPLGSLPASSGGGTGGGLLPPLTTPGAPVNGRTPDPPAGFRLPLPSYAQSMVAQLAAARPDFLISQSCPRGIKYVNSPWQDYIIDELRKLDTRWGYNAKPNRTAADNGGVAVVAAGDEITYHWGPGADQGSTEIYSIDILQSHCGTNPSVTWRDFTGEEPVRWTGAGRF
jgi:hypothetical protein